MNVYQYLYLSPLWTPSIPPTTAGNINSGLNNHNTFEISISRRSEEKSSAESKFTAEYTDLSFPDLDGYTNTHARKSTRLHTYRFGI